MAVSDLSIRIEGRAGRITLTRPDALNALSHDMCKAIDAALIDWADDVAVELVVIDAEGHKAFCAGGDLQQLYATGRAGDFAYGRQFWADEYRLNARIANFPKPFVALMQGYVLGGGVGISCHGSHRIVCESTQISMPECGIGLVPDVGGSLLLARAPGRTGAYLALTAARMGPDDAVRAGFADSYVPRALWPDLIASLQETGMTEAVAKLATRPPEGRLRDLRPEIDALFDGKDLRAILDTLALHDTPFARDCHARMARHSPLSMACTIEFIRRLRHGRATIEEALDLEHRFTARAMENADFLEGVCAAVIDKDRKPVWQHDHDGPLQSGVDHMLAPLGPGALQLQTQENAT